MVLSIGIIVLVFVTQNSLQESVNPECQPDISKGIICLRKRSMDISESRENLRLSNRKAFLNYPERTHESSSTKDVIPSYEGIKSLQKNFDNSQAIGKARAKYLLNFEDQNYKLYSDGSESFDSSENRRIPVALVKSENEEDVSYKKPERLRNYISESTDISDSKSEFETLNHLRNSLNINANSVKYDSYENIRKQLDKDKWHYTPSKSYKSFFGALIKGAGKIAFEIGIGKVIEKIFE